MSDNRKGRARSAVLLRLGGRYRGHSGHRL